MEEYTNDVAVLVVGAGDVQGGYCVPQSVLCDLLVTDMISYLAFVLDHMLQIAMNTL